MDLTSAVINGLVSGSISLGMAYAALKFLKRRLIQGIIGDFALILGAPENRAQIETLLTQELTKYVTMGLKAVHDNPKMLTPIIQGLSGDIMSALPAGMATGSLAEAANSPLGDAAMQFLPKKWRGVAYLARLFMGSGGDKKASGTGGSGF